MEFLMKTLGGSKVMDIQWKDSSLYMSIGSCFSWFYLDNMLWFLLVYISYLSLKKSLYVMYGDSRQKIYFLSPKIQIKFAHNGVIFGLKLLKLNFFQSAIVKTSQNIVWRQKEINFAAKFVSSE